MKPSVEQPLSAYVEDLRLQADHCWDAGEYCQSLLLLEHACALVAVYDISEEGGTDYMIKRHVLKLSKMGRVDVLKVALENHTYFPQICSWIWGWAGEMGSEHEAFVSSNLDHLWKTECEVASLHDKMVYTLKNNAGGDE